MRVYTYIYIYIYIYMFPAGGITLAAVAEQARAPGLAGISIGRARGVRGRGRRQNRSHSIVYY